MGRELFDYALKCMRIVGNLSTQLQKTFRTMEDASAVDLDWFFRGWFYSTDFVDIESMM
jgi:hypothetical protein